MTTDFFSYTAFGRFFSTNVFFTRKLLLGRKVFQVKNLDRKQIWSKLSSAENFSAKNNSTDTLFGWKTIRPEFFWARQFFGRKNFRVKQFRLISFRSSFSIGWNESAIFLFEFSQTTLVSGSSFQRPWATRSSLPEMHFPRLPGVGRKKPWLSLLLFLLYPSPPREINKEG